LSWGQIGGYRYHRKEENDMKKMILLIFLFLFIPALLYGQDKVEAPVWNVGDKWSLTDDVNILVANTNESGYVVKYITGRGESVLIYEKSSLNRLYAMDKEKRIPYEGRNKRLFNFPLEIGKSWTDKFKIRASTVGAQELTVVETFTPLAWEDIEIKAGKFKAVKLEYKQETVGQSSGPPKEGKAWYWYSPDVKYMLKCYYERTDYWDAIYDWELTSFKLIK
jgi:hypothetical protein